MDMNKQMAILLCALLLLELPALPLCGAANPGVQLGVTADAGTIPAWGSCNLTARLTQDGAPLGNVDITWEVSYGVTERNISSTDSSGQAAVSYTAVISASHSPPGTVTIRARATVGSDEYMGNITLNIDPKPVEWTGQVHYRANAGELYPGDSLLIEVEIDQPEGQKCNYVANFMVEANLMDSGENIVNTVVLGKNLSLTPGMKWSSGEQVLLQVPQNPTTLSYLWTFYILTPHGTWVYYQPENNIPVKILTAGKDAWTYLLYLNGDNSLYGWTKDYFNYLEFSAPNNEFKFLIQWDLPGKATTRWKLAFDIDPSSVKSDLLDTFPNVDSGSPDTILNFLDWGATLAPAGHYLLSIWDHGASFYGSSFDDTSYTQLWNAKLASSLEKFSIEHRKIDVLVLDSCLMSSIESIYMFMDEANFMLGCQVPSVTDLLTRSAISKLKTYYPGSPTPRQVAQDIISGYKQTNGSNQPMTATDLAAAHAAQKDLDALGKSLLKKWAPIKKYMMEARQSSTIICGPYGGQNRLVDSDNFFYHLMMRLYDKPVELAEQISAIKQFLVSHDAMIVDRVLVGEHGGHNLFLPPTTAEYKQSRNSYLYSGLPETHGWVQVLDRLFLPLKPSKPGSQPAYPAHPDYSNYPIVSTNVLPHDTNSDGLYEAVSADILSNQTGNGRPVTVVVDLIAYNGSKGAQIGGLVDRNVYTVAPGAETRQNITLKSPVGDLTALFLTVLTDKGAPLENIYLGRFWMNASERTGQPPQLDISASSASVTEGQAANFSATGPQVDNLTIWWDFDDRNGVGIDQTGASASTAYRGGWNRTVTCIASDGTNLAVRTLNIVVTQDLANRQPTANLTSLFLDASHPLKVTLNASRTSDPDGEPVEYLFDFGDENTTVWASGAEVEHEYATPGNYECVVMVRDHTTYNGSFATETVQPGTTTISLPPVPVLKLSASNVRAGKALTADASGSSDPDGSLILFRISWGDGNVTDWSGSANATHIFAKAGNYTITLTVRDRWDIAASTTSTVVVTPKPKPATRGFIPGPTVAAALVAVALAVALTRVRKRKDED